MTQIVGIVNATPDSFSDGGQWNNPAHVLDRVETLFTEGADIIDIGAESTRPGARDINPKEEWLRLRPVIHSLRERYPAYAFSIDTRHAYVARLAIQNWSDDLIINDVTGLYDPEMIEVVAHHRSQVVVSHLPKEANGDITAAHKIKETSLDKVTTELDERVKQLIERDIDPVRIIIDPGIGFGKHPDLNWRLIKLADYTTYPVMIGYSRKRFLGDRRLDPEYNASVGRRAIVSGAAYLRVHDVAAHAAIK